MRRAFILLLACACLGSAQAQADTALIAGLFSPPRLAPDFSLRASNGGTLDVSRYRGKVVLLAFGYSHCGSVCPTTLTILAQARRQLGARAAEVQVLYVTVDPERDDIERMRKFVTGFDPSFIGGTGTPAELAAVRRSYGISVSDKIPGEGGYTLVHSSYVYLIDKHGLLRALMPFGHTVSDFAHDVRALVQE
jgi:protein SCO1/2